jgi:hypothetical protein
MIIHQEHRDHAVVRPSLRHQLATLSAAVPASSAEVLVCTSPI